MTSGKAVTREFTREEFYDFVWSAPATKLAKEIGCSDVMIGKICKSYDIPKPYLGYWARLAHGKKPERIKLPKNDDPSLQTLCFHKHPELEVTVDKPPRASEYDDDILQMLVKAKQLGQVEVPKTLRKPHRLVAELIERFKFEQIPWEKRPSDSPIMDRTSLVVQVSNGEHRRACRIMNALIKRIEDVGGKIEVRSKDYRGSETVVIFGDEEAARIRLREKHNQVRTENKDAEYSWQKKFRTDLVPSGILMFDEGPSSFGTPLLKDKKDSQIENRLGDLVIKLIDRTGEKRLQRREQDMLTRRRQAAEEVERQVLEAEKLRQLEAERIAAEKEKRIDYLMRLVTSQQQAKQIREFVENARTVIGERDMPTEVVEAKEELLSWAIEYADSIDPLRDILSYPERPQSIKLNPK